MLKPELRAERFLYCT